MEIKTALVFASVLWCSVVAAADVPATSYFHKRLVGRIGDKLAVTFDMKNVNGELSGRYRYEGKRVDLYLHGKLDPSGSFVMDEFDGSKVTGRFAGTIAAGHVTGTWQSADGRRALPVVADQVSEIIIGTKPQILKSAVGTYVLANISGSGGANGMWDTWKERGRWKSNSSGISGGMRVASERALSKHDLALLEGLRVVIDPDLSLRLVARGKELLRIPFQADGMPHELRGEHKPIAIEALNQMSARTTVRDEHLYLLVRDGVDYSQALSGSFIALAEDILVVSYSIVDKNVELRFIEGQCCGSTQWTFAPRK